MEYTGNMNGCNYRIVLDKVNRQIIVHYESYKTKAKRKHIFQLYKQQNGHISMRSTTNKNLYRLGLQWCNLTKGYSYIYSSGSIIEANIDILHFPQFTLENLFDEKYV